jgi:hypothetical protein
MKQNFARLIRALGLSVATLLAAAAGWALAGSTLAAEAAPISAAFGVYSYGSGCGGNPIDPIGIVSLLTQFPGRPPNVGSPWCGWGSNLRDLRSQARRSTSPRVAPTVRRVLQWLPWSSHTAIANPRIRLTPVA